MASYNYLDDQWNGQYNAQPDVTVLNQGDVLVSPNGLYNMTVTPTGLVAGYGSAPGTTPAIWSVTQNTSGYSPPYSYKSNDASADGDNVVAYELFGNKNGTLAPTGTSTDYYAGFAQAFPNFEQLNNDGTISIWQGNNGVKAVSNEAPLSTFGTPGSQPVSVTVTTVSYDFAHATFGAATPVFGRQDTVSNGGSVSQLYNYSTDLTYSNTTTFNWNMSATLSGTISSSIKVGIPGIGEQTNTISVTGSGTLSNGQSTTATQTQQETNAGNITVPAGATYAINVEGFQQTADVPFTWIGDATYQNGVTAPVDLGSGTAVINDTGAFVVQIDCTSGCLGHPLAVPELPTVATFPMGLAAILALFALRKRRNGFTRGWIPAVTGV